MLAQSTPLYLFGENRLSGCGVVAEMLTLHVSKSLARAGILFYPASLDGYSWQLDEIMYLEPEFTLEVDLASYPGPTAVHASGPAVYDDPEVITHPRLGID